MAINETALLATPIIGSVVRILQAFSVLVGGIFGLYIVLIVLRWFEYKKFGKVLRDIRAEVRELNEKISFTNSKVPAAKKPAKKKR